ncbi:MAG: MATE family efflux transporter [Eubacteriales bacterium]
MKNQNLTEGNVLTSLLTFTYPILLSMLLQITYGTADLLIVGQFSSVEEVSAVTIGSQIMNTITSFCTGLAMGTTILLGMYIGSGKSEKASKVVGTSISLFSIIGFLISLYVMLSNDAIATIMKTPTESFVQTKSYLFLAGFGTLFIVAYNVLGSIFRGIGDSKTPLIAVAIACIANILLDFILVAWLEQGATGAAIATVTAQAISVILSLVIIRKKALPFTLTKNHLRFSKHYIKKILMLGIPVALQGVLVSISFLFITSIINTLGIFASAAVGIVEKITGIVMIVPLSFSQSLAAFTAQNFGANEFNRARKALHYSIVFSLSFGIITAYLSAFHGTIFTTLFTSDVNITRSALEYLKSYAIDCIFVAIMFSFNGYFNGCGSTTFVMIHSIAGAFFVRIPLAYFFSTLPNTNLFLIGLSTPSSTLLQIFLCLGYYYYTKKKVTSHL